MSNPTFDDPSRGERNENVESMDPDLNTNVDDLDDDIERDIDDELAEEVDDEAGVDEPLKNDRIANDERENGLVTNDAVAGETVLPGEGSGNRGPTGGSPREGEPNYGPEAPGAGSIRLGDDDTAPAEAQTVQQEDEREHEHKGRGDGELG